MQPTNNIQNFCPTLLAPGLLGVDESTYAWQRVRHDFLDNPLPLNIRVALTCAAWEQPSGPSAIHATGMSLIGHADARIDLADTWRRLLENPASRRMLMVSRYIAHGLPVPSGQLRETMRSLGRWRQAWSDLLSYAAWAQAMHQTNAASVAPMEDPRLNDWLGQVVQAGGTMPPITLKSRTEKAR